MGGHTSKGCLYTENCFNLLIPLNKVSYWISKIKDCFVWREVLDKQGKVKGLGKEIRLTSEVISLLHWFGIEILMNMHVCAACASCRTILHFEIKGCLVLHVQHC